MPAPAPHNWLFRRPDGATIHVQGASADLDPGRLQSAILTRREAALASTEYKPEPKDMGSEMASFGLQAIGWHGAAEAVHLVSAVSEALEGPPPAPRVFVVPAPAPDLKATRRPDDPKPTTPKPRRGLMGG